MVKRLHLLKDLRLAAIFFVSVTIVVMVTVAIKDGFTPFFFILLTMVILFSFSAFLMELKIRYYRSELKKIPREHRGHQDEPGSWQCTCGRYNAEYRSICIGCGREKKRHGLF